MTTRLSLLADTWWYGSTRRWSRAEFEELTRLRAEQGFDAVQIVVGIPPEVGPLHPEAASEVGPAWTLRGAPNARYLSVARDRVALLLEAGLRPIVYGGWGQHIDWIGVAAMKRWWDELASTFSDFEVVYCLCGEVDLYLDAPRMLLPDRCTDELGPPSVLRRLRRRVHRIGPLSRWLVKARHRRIEAWREVLRHARLRVGEPLLVHTTGQSTAFELFGEDRDLLANSTQTGHDSRARPLLYERPLDHLQHFSDRPFMNLEPWYEGIRDSFGMRDQLFAFWASKLAGSTGHVYGAHGIWNAGDGHFLAHWGRQTWREAIVLQTPVLLGKLHRWFRSQALDVMPTYARRGADGRLLRVGRGGEDRFVELCLEHNAERGASTMALDLSGQVTDRCTPPLLFVHGLPAPHER